MRSHHRTECGMFVMCVPVKCFVVCGMCCLEDLYKCNCDVFSVVNKYLDHLKLCVLMLEGMSLAVNAMCL